jgi:hypothetical protein
MSKKRTKGNFSNRKKASFLLLFCGNDKKVKSLGLDPPAVRQGLHVEKDFINQTIPGNIKYTLTRVNWP